jgi:hypothetical protein
VALLDASKWLNVCIYMPQNLEDDEPNTGSSTTVLVLPMLSLSSTAMSTNTTPMASASDEQSHGKVKGSTCTLMPTTPTPTFAGFCLSKSSNEPNTRSSTVAMVSPMASSLSIATSTNTTPTAATFEATLHSAYLCLKVPALLGVISVHGSQKDARNIEQGFAHHHKNMNCLQEEKGKGQQDTSTVRKASQPICRSAKQKVFLSTQGYWTKQ